jgi:SNF2 family DNA or RNA helicase
MLRQIEFWYIILDESQLIKNPQSKLFRAVKQLKSKHRLVLTGTPIENSLVDLWAQLSFLNDGLLGNLPYFKEEYAIPIEKNGSTQQEEKLQKIISPFILRRTKEMVARDLPSLTEQIYYCEMSEEQKSLYEEKKSEIRNMILDNITRMGTDKSRFVILKGLMQLRLLSNHPRLYLGDDSEELNTKVIPSGKFEEVVRNLENLKAEGHKVLVYSQFVKHLRLFKEYFEANGHDYSILTGQTINDERQKVIKEFQEDPEKNFFLITLKAGGVGLNLTAAEYVFLLDPWWNPAVENQAISRAHRIGQERKVFSYKFITRDTIEEKIMQLQSRKSELASLFINNNNPLRFFTKETIVKLME